MTGTGEPDEPGDGGVPAPPLVEALRTRLQALRLVTDPAVMEGYSRDRTAILSAGSPMVVAFPRSAEEVRGLLELASSHRVPVVPRGAGSGLAGGANAIDGCVVVSTERMDRVVEVDAEDRVAVVEPGVLNASLKGAVEAVGLWYPPDPASFEFSTIGGNVATNAGGLCCVGHGMTGDFVLGLEVVLADGTIVHTGGRTRKRAAGYDLTRLFVGSEGTLGVITQVTVRLLPPEAPSRTVLASFPRLAQAGHAVTGILGRIVPRSMEVMDRTTIEAVERWRALGLDANAGALLLIQTSGPPGEGGGGTDEVARICEEAGAGVVVLSTDPVEADLLMTARRLAYPALERLGTALLDDVAVPVSRVPELIGSIERIAEERGVVVGTFGHAADGNMHPTIVFDGSDEASADRAGLAFQDIVAAAIGLGGTISGEHGVGSLKSRFMDRELGPDARDLHRTIKRALDPLEILNPGKAI